MNSTLKSKAQWREATQRVLQSGWLSHPDHRKNWDHLAALNFIRRHTIPMARVLDAGGELSSTLVDWLSCCGYRSLHVLNLSFKRNFRIGPIQYRRGDCTDSPYPSRYFDVVASLSVIEHGVAVDRFLQESHRILRPGGYLIVSTDYWRVPIDTDGKTAYGAPVKIFTPGEIQTIIDTARFVGFRTTGPLDYTVREKAIHWNGMDLNYTFIIFALRKKALVG